MKLTLLVLVLGLMLIAGSLAGCGAAHPETPETITVVEDSGGSRLISGSSVRFVIHDEAGVICYYGTTWGHCMPLSDTTLRR